MLAIAQDKLGPAGAGSVVNPFLRVEPVKGQVEMVASLKAQLVEPRFRRIEATEPEKQRP